MERKQILGFEFKAETAESDGNVGVFDGYASTFGNVDLGMDVVEKGAFKKTIKEKNGRFPILLDHDPSKPAGWNLEASEDDNGLKVKGELQLESPEVKQRWALIKRASELKTKMGLSIGYMPVKYSIERGDPQKSEPTIRQLKEIKLFEYSIVTFPMNEQAGTTSAKAEEIAEFIKQVQLGRYDLRQIQMALEKFGSRDPEAQAAEIEADPELLQSVDKLIAKIRA